MQEGARIHRKIQSMQGPEYRSEVTLETTYDSAQHDIRIILDGRADGIIDNTEADPALALPPFTIDEIKGTYRKVQFIDKPDNVHLAQAKCYAYIYAAESDLDCIGVRITYCNLETEDIRYFDEICDYGDLSEWFSGLMEEYARWIRMQEDWKVTRDTSIKSLDFPYEYRKGQKELVTHVYHTICHGRKLFLEAPTGVGKTIATVFPTVKAIGEQKANRFFYLTAKTITRTVAENTLNLMRDKGLDFKSVVLTAKDKICFLEERECNPEACPYAKGHYDRINEALFTLLTGEQIYSRQVIEKYAADYKVCPFELSLDVSLFCDGVICDYNYLFDPHVRLKRFFVEGGVKDSIFLIDEAHNLVDRGRNMFSATLIKEDFLALKKTVKVYDPVMYKRLEKCNHELLAMKRSCEELTVLEDISNFIIYLERLYSQISFYLENHEASPVRDEVLDFFFEISHFLLIYDLVDDNYITYCYILDNGDFAIRLFNVNPASNLKACMEKGVSSILFSATLLPIDYYRQLLGADDKDYEVYAESTFDPSRRLLTVAEDVTSRYTERGATTYARAARYIHNIVSSHTGNYMVFAPSHIFMRKVAEEYDILVSEDPGIRRLIQDEHMNEAEREEFLNEFSSESETSLVGFCVLGGIFSEGIDLKGEDLIGAIIIGTGLPLYCKENELIKDYFDRMGYNGRKYAYTYPGFNKVLQAAGRVVRTHEDTGIIALLDYRFKYSEYRDLFPREWNSVALTNEENIRNLAKNFWDGL